VDHLSLHGSYPLGNYPHDKQATPFLVKRGELEQKTKASNQTFVPGIWAQGQCPTIGIDPEGLELLGCVVPDEGAPMPAVESERPSCSLARPRPSCLAARLISPLPNPG
jgi:hypothetical protein